MTSAVLARGANTRIDEPAVRVLVAWRAGTSVDPCALLVAADGKVRADEDFVCSNQPRDPSGAVELSMDGRTASLSVRLDRLPEDVDRVVVAGALDTVLGLEISVTGGGGRVLATVPMFGVEPVAALVFGEFYRRQGQWKFRAVGQGWASGLSGLATYYGVTVEGEPAPAAPPAAQRRPDWYPAADDPDVLRWWTGTGWSAQTVPVVHDAAKCRRCGGPNFRLFARHRSICNPCGLEMMGVLGLWRTKAAQVIAASGTTGPAWDDLWSELRYLRVEEDSARAVLRPIGLHHLHRLLAFAFVDNVVEQHEVDRFDDAVRRLGIADPAITEMRRRLQRGLDLGLIANGRVPRVARTTLELGSSEILHLDTPAVRVEYRANGPARSNGRLVATSTKLLFTGASGAEVSWAKVLEVRPERGSVVVSTTTRAGRVGYQVSDPEHVAAVITGALRIAKRIAVIPGQRDSRAIPQAVRTEVWRRDGGACVDCRATEFLEFDHVIPWSRGGATSVGNLQLLCRTCNLAKGARI